MSVAAANMEYRPLPPVSRHVDATLAQIDAKVDWLTAVSPIHNDALWHSFEDSGRASIAPLQYPRPRSDLRALRSELERLPMEDVESAVIEGLLREKQREIDRQIELVEMRGTDGFINASIDLFGGVDAQLLSLARDILATVEPGPELAHDADVRVVVAAAVDDLAWYRKRRPEFDALVIVDPDLASLMVVSNGDLYVAKDIRVPMARVQPLVQHEIGTHVVTRHNGSYQALRQFEVGLAHYDALQEGLGVLAEFLAGYLPAERLRVLAARVVAVDMVIHGEDVPAIFDCLHNEHGLPTEDAFDTAVRARRGGGLTKDAVYLSGLRDLLAYLHDGGDFERLFIGKFALAQMVIVEQLLKLGWVSPPDVLPRYCSGADWQKRLALCRNTPIQKLYHTEPIPQPSIPQGRTPQGRIPQGPSA